MLNPLIKTLNEILRIFDVRAALKIKCIRANFDGRR